MDIVQLWNFADPAASEQRFRAALADARGDERLEIETQIARTFSLRSQFAQAHAILDRIEPEINKAGVRPRLRYLLERGRTFNSAGDKAKARPLFVQAWELGQQAHEEYLAIDAAHMVAIAEGGEKGIEWGRMALPLALNAKDPQARRWRGPLLNNIGWELNELGRHDEALDYFREALTAYEERGDKRTIRAAHWMIGHTLRLMGRHDEALAIQRRLKAELEASGETDEYVDKELQALQSGQK